MLTSKFKTFVHCLFDVGNDIIHILYTYRQADEVGGNTGCLELLLGEQDLRDIVVHFVDMSTHTV